jgi:hypothetical protein
MSTSRRILCTILCYLLISITAVSDADCNYNGANMSGSCTCVRPWIGLLCDVLDLSNVTSESVGLGYQGADGNGSAISSWGGSVLLDDAGVSHMYLAEMEGGCGINVWLSNSAVIHATSPDPLTVPFKRVSVVQGVFAHEPIAVRAPTGEFVVYFTAVLPEGLLPVNGPNGIGEPCTGCGNGISSAHCGTDSNRNASINLPTYMVYSVNPDGPWSPPALIPFTDVFADSNFAPWINADGSLIALGRNRIWSASDWKNVSSYVIIGNWKDTGEDPFIWRTADGVYHGIIHHGRPRSYGMHYYSDTNGASWIGANTKIGWDHAFSSTIYYTNGTNTTFFCRERPHIVLNKDGTIIALTNGAALVACHDAGADDRSFTFLQGMN